MRVFLFVQAEIGSLLDLGTAFRVLHFWHRSASKGLLEVAPLLGELPFLVDKLFQTRFQTRLYSRLTKRPQ